MRRTTYSKPFMALERFKPQEFVAMCAEEIIPELPANPANETYAYVDTHEFGVFNENEQGAIGSHGFTATRDLAFGKPGDAVTGVKIGTSTFNGTIYRGIDFYKAGPGNGSTSAVEGASYADATNFFGEAVFAKVGTYDIFIRPSSRHVYIIGGVGTSGTSYISNHS